VPRQLVAYLATFGTQSFSLKLCQRQLFVLCLCYAEDR